MAPERGDVLPRLDRRVRVRADRVLLRGQAEGVPAHRVEHVEALHARVARDDVGRRVALGVAHVEARARRVREHVEDVFLPAAGRARRREDAELGPAALPARLDLGVIVGDLRRLLVGHGALVLAARARRVGLAEVWYIGSVPRSALLIDGPALLDADLLLRTGLAERRASFELSIRRLPPHTGFAIVAGVEPMIERVSAPLVDPTEVELARRVCGLSDELVDRLVELAPNVDVDVVPEGTVAFVGEADRHGRSDRFHGGSTVLAGRLLRTILQRGTAVATRTSRLKVAAGEDLVIDGTSGRAPADASLEVARAAFVGGAAMSTNPLACAALGIPFRADAQIDLGSLAPAPLREEEGGWGDSPTDKLIDLGIGDDDEAVLLEAKRLGRRAGGWLARGLAEQASLPSMRFDLIALEETGAWSARSGASGSANVVPGRKRIARYADAQGRLVLDLVHLQNERMQSPRTLGAVTLSPVVRPVLRGGRTLERAEPASVGRERAIASRRTLAPALVYLRDPATYRVELSPGLQALVAERRG